MSDTSVFLGLECGGTHTVALAADDGLQQLARVEAGPANLRLVTDAQLVAHFRALRRQLPAPGAIGVGMAGVRDATDCARVERALEKVWPGVPRRVDHDLESALASAELDATGKLPDARVIVLSGTGSCCYGRNAAGKTAKAGGWGHLLGDRGSGYNIAFTALRELARQFDQAGSLGAFGESLLQRLQLNEPNDLIAWIQAASKTEVAALAPLVFSSRPSAATTRAITEAAADLAQDATACAGRLMGRNHKAALIEFVFAGSVLLKQGGFAQAVAAQIRQTWPAAVCRPLTRESVWGAVAMARTAVAGIGAVPARSKKALRRTAGPADLSPIPSTRELSPTERRNPRSMKLDELPLTEALELMWSEEATIPDALRAQRAQVEKLIRLVGRAFHAGGRLFYVGAGTSGRLGVLDASECPPTFRTPPELVQGIIAGGAKALHSAVEGAEDDTAAGSRAVTFRGVGPSDVVVGIAASGRTPFVWGALEEARRCGAKTALIAFNPHLVFVRGHRPDLVIAPDLGPEVLTGSTRLKAGTATKLILNAVTTLAMVRQGKVIGNLMVDLNPSNVKLRDRAVRIVTELSGATHAEALKSLENRRWVVATAIRDLKRPPAARINSSLSMDAA